jgi:N-methylhydantoinase B/oxoprolinase/acetone carboxylase alpha subunit
MPAELTRPDPIRLEIFKNLYQFIAEQMGIVLQNTATSVNIKERLDFSCAVFDRDGCLVANAPHIPVHLGSMSDSVMSLIAAKLFSMLQPVDTKLILGGLLLALCPQIVKRYKKKEFYLITFC